MWAAYGQSKVSSFALPHIEYSQVSDQDRDGLNILTGHISAESPLETPLAIVRWVYCNCIFDRSCHHSIHHVLFTCILATISEISACTCPETDDSGCWPAL